MNLENVKNKILNFPVVLFFIILINYIPLIIPNMVSKESHGVDAIYIVTCFGIQCILLCIYLFKKVEITKETKKNIILLSIVSLILFVIQIKNFIIGEYRLMDFANVICQFVNVLLLFIAILNMKSEEKYISYFMKAMAIFGVLSCINNMILYFNEILQTLGLQKGAFMVNIKSFFANRNQFAFFMYVVIIADMFIILKENKIIYKLLLALFFVNLFFTMSRTGILVVGIFVFIYFLLTDKLNKKSKLILLVLGMICLIGIICVINEVNPDLIQKIARFERIKDLSGRTDIWARGINLIKENPINILFGVGRFQGVQILKFETKSFTQFHNIYIDSLVTGGIMELVFVLYIYWCVIRKVFKSDMDKKYKKLYLTMFITFAIYICFESFGRFSMGCSDTLCLIFFVTIPLLHANSCGKTEKLETEGDKK